MIKEKTLLMRNFKIKVYHFYLRLISKSPKLFNWLAGFVAFLTCIIIYLQTKDLPENIKTLIKHTDIVLGVIAILIAKLTTKDPNLKKENSIDAVSSYKECQKKLKGLK